MTALFSHKLVMYFTFTTKKIHLEEQKQNCLPVFRSLELTSSALETKMFFFHVYIFLRANSATCFFADHLEKDVPWKTANIASLHHWKPQWKQPLSSLENFPTQSWERKVNDPWQCNPHISFDTASTFEFTWKAEQYFHTLLSRILRCDQMQSLSSSFEFKKVAISTASRVVSAYVFLLSLALSLSFSLSKSQKTSCRVSLEDISEWHLFSIFLSFWSKIPNHTAWRSHKGSGAHMGQDDTVAPSPESLGPSLLLWPVEGLASPTALLWRRQLSPSRVSSSAFSPPPASRSRRLLLASCPALLPFFALTLVIGWFLTVSLLLLSHSGASVVAVENGYPCLFFFVITQIKIPMN